MARSFLEVPYRTLGKELSLMALWRSLECFHKLLRLFREPPVSAVSGMYVELQRRLQLQKGWEPLDLNKVITGCWLWWWCTSACSTTWSLLAHLHIGSEDDAQWFVGDQNLKNHRSSLLKAKFFSVSQSFLCYISKFRTGSLNFRFYNVDYFTSVIRKFSMLIDH